MKIGDINKASTEKLLAYETYLSNKQRKLLNTIKESGVDITETDEQLLTKIRNRRQEVLDVVDKRKKMKTLAGDDLDTRADSLRNSHLQGSHGLGDNHDGIGRIEDNFLKDPKRGFANPREFILAVQNAGQGRGKAAANLRSLYAVDNTIGADEHSTFSDPHGGFLVPTAFTPSPLLTAPEPASVTFGGSGPSFLSPLTRRVVLDRPSVKFNARVDKNHTTSVSGGLLVTRRAEASARDASRMQFEQIEMQANSLWGFSYATEELLMDSPIAFASLLAASFGDEFRSAIISERLNGTGVGEYLGVLNSANLALISINRTTSNELDGQDVLNMRSRCWGYENAVWMCHPDAMPFIAKLNVESATPIGVISFFQMSLATDTPDRILGRPLIVTEYMPSVTAAGALGLFNWNEYLEGTYMPLRSDESIHVRFESAEKCFRFWMRNDGRPWWKSVLTPKNSVSSFTLSPFVTLNDN